MKRVSYLHVLLIIFCFGCGLTIDNLELDRYEEEIVEFERENQYQGARKGMIVFLGSAPVKQWPNMAASFQGMPVKNRGFGDATIREVIHYFRRLTDPFQPELLVMYAGESDIVLGASPEGVLQSFQDFIQQIAISERASRVIYISIMPSPAHWSYWPEIQKANALIQQVAKENPRIDFLDISKEMLGTDGKPIVQLFEADGLSLNTAGYARWTNALLPVLEKMF